MLVSRDVQNGISYDFNFVRWPILHTSHENRSFPHKLFGAVSDSLKTSITGIGFSSSVSGLRTASLAAYVMFVVNGRA